MKKVLFLTLNTFSATGGIEKVCRAAGKALYEICTEEGGEFAAYSLYDKKSDVLESYLPASVFQGFGGKKFQFVWEAIRRGRVADTVILSHVNLLLAGWLIKKLSAKTKLVLIAHGIEVWQPLRGFKKKMIKCIDLFLPVSEYTGKKLQHVLHIPRGKIEVLNNCLDPFLQKVQNTEKEKNFRKKYGFSDADFIMLTLTRIKYSEQYKGYDKVVAALGTLKKTYPYLKYLIAGRFDIEEKARLDNLIDTAGVKDRVVFSGFIDDADVATHFNLADLYIMPSTGEGFGIVFIEALFYGKPVIAGNVDGSVDALAKGEFGLLVNPESQEEIVQAITSVIKNRFLHLPVHENVIANFGFEGYKQNCRTILGNRTTARKAVQIQ